MINNVTHNTTVNNLILIELHGNASDIIPPWFDPVPGNQLFEVGDPVLFDVNGTDDFGDVVYSINRLLEIGEGPASLFSGVLDKNSTTAVDEHTVKFELLKSFAPFLDVIPWLFIVNSKIVEEHKGNDFGPNVGPSLGRTGRDPEAAAGPAGPASDCW